MKFEVEQHENDHTVIWIEADAFTPEQIAGINELADRGEHPDVEVKWTAEGVQIVLPADPAKLASFHVSVLARDFFPDPFEAKKSIGA